MRVQQLHCVVSGRVQGVAFRNFVKEIAIEMELHGFVANLPDGSLEVLVQGKYEVLKVFLEHLARGPDGALVTGLYDEWERDPEQLYEDFQILP
ncbi:Acylphosphatase [sediment metagenome]|uniref:Acylphosphatase n=1 Tax=sediment metagenome TaxID=749907 RepID=D9PKQ7_9ZZZZ